VVISIVASFQTKHRPRHGAFARIKLDLHNRGVAAANGEVDIVGHAGTAAVAPGAAAHDPAFLLHGKAKPGQTAMPRPTGPAVNTMPMALDR
jgi:hypothetical protein